MELDRISKILLFLEAVDQKQIAEIHKKKDRVDQVISTQIWQILLLELMVMSLLKQIQKKMLMFLHVINKFNKIKSESGNPATLRDLNPKVLQHVLNLKLHLKLNQNNYNLRKLTITSSKNLKELFLQHPIFKQENPNAVFLIISLLLRF